MMWARKHRFGLSTPWFLHCRLDASLQFGRDYMMSEVDIVSPANVSSWQGVGGDGVLYTRLLVGQTLGARASGVVVKTKKTSPSTVFGFLDSVSVSASFAQKHSSSSCR